MDLPACPDSSGSCVAPLYPSISETRVEMEVTSSDGGMAMTAWRWRQYCIILIVMAPAFASAADSTERGPLVIVENQGNSSFECIVSGPCSPCSYAEKQNDDIYHCGFTGYYMPYQCVEVKAESDIAVSENSSDETEPSANSNKKSLGRPILQGSVQRKELHRDGGSVRKLLFEAETSTTGAGRKIYHIFKSCIPPVAEDRLSVLGFEGMMLGLLAVFSPVLYYRKKRGFVMSGMTRIPSSARF